MRKNYLPFGRPNFCRKEIDAVTSVMKDGWIGQGPITEKFEEELSEKLGAPNVVTVNSCTSALFLSLLVSDVKEGDEVICPSFTWCSTANAVLYLGAIPVFCDIDSESLNITAESIKSCLTLRTKAVLVVHLGGLAVDVNTIRNDLPDSVEIIEDAAHAIGAKYPDGKPVGSSGNLVCFSFYANKNLSTGEGGAIALTDTQKAEKLKSLRLHALSADAWNRFNNAQNSFTPQISELGYKMNYTDLNAAIGRVQLKRQSEFSVLRQSVSEVYVSKLHKYIPGIRFQKDVLEDHHAKHLFLCILPNEGIRKTRDELIIALRKENIGASLHYEPLHRMPLYNKYNRSPLPVTEQIGSRVLTLPIGNTVSMNDAKTVVKAFQKVI